MNFENEQAKTWVYTLEIESNGLAATEIFQFGPSLCDNIDPLRFLFFFLLINIIIFPN